MNTVFPIQETPQTGPRYWRSLDELADTPEFKQWVDQEFPEGASELNREVTRRDFVKLMSASFLLAGFGLSGCRRPEEIIVPFSKMPEGYVHGVVKYFATAMPTRRNAIPLLAKSADGRPVKLEGNQEHPLSGGGTDSFAQASILNLYDPDRSRQFLNDGENSSEEAAFSHLKTVADKFARNRGQGLSILSRESSSPTRRRLQALLTERLPQAKWCEYEPVSFGRSAEAATIAFGRALSPRYHFDRASRIVSLDCDFLGDEEDAYVNIKGFADGRSIEKPSDEMSRLYVVEGLMTLTGSNADHRLRVPTSGVFAVAAALLAEALEQNESASGNSQISALKNSLRQIAETANVSSEWVLEAVKDLAAHQGHSLVVAGYRQPVAVHFLAHALNLVLDNIGHTVEFAPGSEASTDSIANLKAALDAGTVETLVLLGGNPAYDAPAELGWAEAQKKVREVIRLGYYVDESSQGATWHFPETHFLERWGDAATSDGTRVAVQPLIAPLFGGLSDIELISRILKLEDPSGHAQVRATFDAEVKGANEEQWKKFLHDGFVADSASASVSVGAARFNWSAVGPAILNAEKAPPPSRSSIEAVFYRDASMDDGQFNNNGWMQEFPDPMTKLTWDNVALLSRETAGALGVSNGDIVRIELNGRSVEGPAWVMPGMANNSVGLALGYGRSRSGRIGGFNGQAVGFDVNPIRTSAGAYIAPGAAVSFTGRQHKLATTQDHWSMEGRAIVREANIEQFREKQKPDFARNMGLEAHGQHIPRDKDGKPLPMYKHPYDVRESLKSDIHQWGMTIDLNRCVGCSACVVACQSENNIPIVGKVQVAKSREMHWMRIDRYFSGGVAAKSGLSSLEADENLQYQEWIDDPQVVTQPMLCQHCEYAPCENVCPVNATVHDHEGLNVMAYNRCVGTRYCSNNCAWKVRRFNFFDYNKRPLEALYDGPLAERPKDDLDLVAMAKNPEVTVRMRGVMEKCTFCVQRIENAKIQQKVAARDSDKVAVSDGTIQTACEQACPADAIVFGNTLDPESRVSKLKESPRNYAVLGFLDTRPRTTYLAKVRNPNPAMPDYHKMPLSTEEYSVSMGDPFSDHHGAAHGDGHDDHGVEADSANGETGGYH
ncbi:MAG: Menaquinone reductase, iron-sulfur cluster-binding subunit [Verrucomicrobia subdivision 3 bacterium]|nr:Menaquinone reductase, iron-sulfur cluster-binding subunit [Limisphaerales bacterium]MCS1415046.1 Menaquinone reductase, iron-sulfur cluster-binding subunit [Limisphaerales bacterium]